MTDRIADRYEVIRPLGRGGFAHTLLARDLSLDRQVAIKVLHPQAAESLKSYQLFEREAAVLRELRHPAVPAVHASFRAPWNGAEAAFLVMEYIEGTSLAEIIADRRHLDPETVLHLLVELLGVLEYLHTRMPPVLHRDIKPANLIIREGGPPALVDFGAVRNVFRGAEDAGSTVVGTYGYMPYEQYMGQASPASDLFALGATFLHLITGRPPPEFMGGSGRLEVPAELPCGEPLRTVLARLLAPSPAERFQSAREARAALLVSAVVPQTSRVQLDVAPDHPGAALGPVPRPLTGPIRDLLKRAAYTPWQLMNTTVRGTNRNPVTMALVVLLSVVTVGILPSVFWNVYLTRKKRLKPFLQHGLPGTARIIDMTKEDIGFGEALVRVRYEFEVAGRRCRGSDQVLPLLCDWWVPGENINILYRPDRNYDSVILSPDLYTNDED